MSPTAPIGSTPHPELDLVEAIAARVTVRPGVDVGIGDDAAVLAGSPAMVVTQDLLVEGVHFRLETTDLRSLGHKALAVNLSDIAAMGASPVAAVVGLALPPSGRSLVADLYAGMEALAAETGCTIAGGDISDAPVLMVSVTAIGRMANRVAPVLRSGARPGDVVCVTGALGASAAGLRLLDEPALGHDLPDEVTAPLTRAHLTPTPRVAAGVALAAAGVHAMLDCSDGLALDAFRMARASGVAIRIDLDHLPVAPGVDRVVDDADVVAATGGEDFELIVALPPDRLALCQAAIAPLPLTPVGTVMKGPPGLSVFRAGAPVVLPRLGWEHGA